jgi:hypothetical protein
MKAFCEKPYEKDKLKSKYGYNHGFVFRSTSTSSNEAIYRLADAMISVGAVKEHPLFYVRLSPVDVGFVYRGNSGFQSVAFFQAAQQAEFMTGGQSFRVFPWSEAING